MSAFDFTTARQNVMRNRCAPKRLLLLLRAAAPTHTLAVSALFAAIFFFRRYQNILAFERTRVKLRNADNDYINANYVGLADVPSRYIGVSDLESVLALL